MNESKYMYTLKTVTFHVQLLTVVSYKYNEKEEETVSCRRFSLSPIVLSLYKTTDRNLHGYHAIQVRVEGPWITS